MMKKFLAIVLAGLMVFSLAACGSGDNAGETAATDGANFDIDFTSEEVQPMAEAKATVEELKKVAEEYLEGNTMFFADERTYEDFVEYIGCDATEYQFNETYAQRNYTWKATDDSTAALMITFTETDGAWKLAAAGSTNLGLL